MLLLFIVSEINQCELFPSVCSQTCTHDPVLKTYECGCAQGYDLQPDGFTCIAKAKGKNLLLSVKRNIVILRVEKSGFLLLYPTLGIDVTMPNILC